MVVTEGDGVICKQTKESGKWAAHGGLENSGRQGRAPDLVMQDQPAMEYGVGSCGISRNMG